MSALPVPVATATVGDPLALLASAVELVAMLRGRAEAEGVPADAVAAVVAGLSAPAPPATVPGAPVVPAEPVAAVPVVVPAPTRPEGTGPVAVPGSPEVLSAREAEVLGLLAAGEPNRAIGDRLFISEHTVKTHVRHVMAKLGARSRAHAVARARQLGIV